MSNVISGPSSVSPTCSLCGGLFEVLTIGTSCIHELISLSVPQSADSLAEVTRGPL